MLILLVAVPAVCALFVGMARLRDRVDGVPAILEQPPEEDSVVCALLWSAWRGHLAPQNAYRAQLLRLARLGAIELRAEGRVTDPKDLTIVRRMDALDLPTEGDQDFLWLLFGRGADAVDEVSVGQAPAAPRRLLDVHEVAHGLEGAVAGPAPPHPEGRRADRVDGRGRRRDRRRRVRDLDRGLGGRRSDRLVARPGVARSAWSWRCGSSPRGSGSRTGRA